MIRQSKSLTTAITNHDPGDEDRRPISIDEHYEWTRDHREGQWAPWTYHRDARGIVRDEPT